MITRRQFLTRAIAAVPVVAAPTALLEMAEELLAPRGRVIFLPPLQGWIYSSELSEIVRRAFTARLITSLYDTSPLLRQLMRTQGNFIGYTP